MNENQKEGPCRESGKGLEQVKLFSFRCFRNETKQAEVEINGWIRQHPTIEIRGRLQSFSVEPPPNDDRSRLFITIFYRLPE